MRSLLSYLLTVLILIICLVLLSATAIGTVAFCMWDIPYLTLENMLATFRWIIAISIFCGLLDLDNKPKMIDTLK